MKNIVTIFTILFTLLINVSCSEDDRELTIATVEESPEVVLVANSANAEYVVTADNTEEVAETFSWTQTDFGFDGQVSYELLADSEGGDFSQSQSLGTTTGTEIEITFGALNEAAIALGLPVGSLSEILFRVEASVSDSVQTIVSEAISKQVSPYQGDIELLDYFLVGGASAAGWENNMNNTPLFRDPENPAVFYYNGYFKEGQFKLLTAKGLWHPQIGSDDGATLSASNADGTDEPGNLGDVTVAGYYSLVVNMGNNTYTFESLDVSSSPAYTAIGLVGTARTGDDTGWNEPDENLVQVSAEDSHLWYVSGITLFEGNLKFRADDAWDIDWGSNTPISGLATIGSGGDGNIPVSAGTYDLWFNDIDGRYIFILN